LKIIGFKVFELVFWYNLFARFSICTPSAAKMKKFVSQLKNYRK